MLMRFADQEGISISQAFVETESGKHDDSRRAQLKAALEAARKLKAPILVAKLDRLSRDVAYIAGLMKHGVPSSWLSLALMQTHSCCTSTPRWLRKSAG